MAPAIHGSQTALDEDQKVRVEGQPHPVDSEAHVVLPAGLVPSFRPLGPSADHGVQSRGTLPIRRSSTIEQNSITFKVVYSGEINTGAV